MSVAETNRRPDIEIADKAGVSSEAALLDASDEGSSMLRIDDSQSASTNALEALILPLRVLALLAVLGALVVGESVFIPLALAVLASLALRPIVRSVHATAGVPAPLTAALIVSIITVLLVSGLYSLGEPAKEWLKEAPNALRALQRQASEVRGPLEDMRETRAVITDLSNGSAKGKTEIFVNSESVVEQSVMMKTSEGFAYSVATLVMLFFILGWGDRLFRNAIALLPGFAERRGAVQVAQAIESAIGRYLLMITLINSCLGFAVAALSYFIGLPNPVLWGVVAALLNYMPYIGAAITTLVLLAVSLISQPLEFPILTAPLAFLVLTTFEGYIVTPYAVGRSLTLNPLIVFFSLLVCFFLWGGIGALLAVPILVSFKVALEGSGRSASLAARTLS
ncbi:AI-2E family transporter [Congregibacter litoralis]|uniref:Putative permease n=1 Tax=Congregibacter litoralis KT71 TaxID=314285 RepID=A4A4W4_9GAMM|nr:AI-2E family transporter [Congregibacter litoralis]EAQ98836.1 putative permease [Congregibacter litoralis KT71]